MAQKEPLTTFEEVERFAQAMRQWAATVEQRLNGAVDLAALQAEANELRTKYAMIPQEIRELEQAKATLVANVATLRDEYEIAKANAMLGCDGGNPETRKAQLRLALVEDEGAAAIAKEIADIELNAKMLEIEIAEKEKLWSDYHKRVVILASMANVNYR